jgi:hypothetical protein
MHFMKKGDTPAPVTRQGKAPAKLLAELSKKAPKADKLLGDLEVYAKTFSGKHKAEFLRSFSMLTPDQQAATNRTHAADADHFYVFSLAFRAGFTKVVVTDNTPDIQNANTLYLTERVIDFIGKEFREHKTPMIVTSRYVTKLSMQYHLKHPQKLPDDLTPGLDLMVL